MVKAEKKIPIFYYCGYKKKCVILHLKYGGHY